MPGTPQPINSPFGNRPSTLPDQVPAQGEMQDAAAASANAVASLQPSLSQSVSPTPPSAMDPTQVDPTLAGRNPASNGDVNAEVDAFLAQNSPSGAGTAEVFQEQPLNGFDNMLTRFKAGLAANDTEVENLLKNKFGAENVRMKNDKLWFKAPGKKSFQPLDPAEFEPILDIFADFSRGAVEEVAALPAELAGGALGGPGGAYAGRIASSPAQVGLADYIAEKAGVPQDPSRSRGMEMAVNSTLEATMPFIGKRLAQLVPGTAAYKAAKEAGESQLSALSKQSQAVAQSVQELAAIGKAATVDGKIVGVPGARVTMGAHQLNPESPAIRKLHDSAKESVPFQNAMQKHAEEWGDLFTGTMREIQQGITKGKTIAPEALSREVVDAVSSVRKLEGENIAKYKAQALKTLGDKPQPMTSEVMEGLSQAMQGMGFTPSGAPKSNAELQKLVGQFGITSIGEARAVANNINDAMNSITTKGGLNIKDMDRFRNSFGDLAERMQGTPLGRQMGMLASGFRENYKQVIESGLTNDFEKTAFRGAMDDYTNIMKNVGVLRNALDEDASSQAIVKKFFTGANDIEKMKSIKSLSPASFDNLRAEWLNQELIKYKSRDSATGFAAGKMLDSWEKKYGPEFMNMVLPKEEQRTVKNFLNVLDRVDQSFAPGKLNMSSEKALQGGGNAIIGALFDVKFKVINGLAALASRKDGGERAAIKLLSEKGIDKLVANYPGKPEQKAMVAQKLKDFVAAYRVNKIIDSPTAKAAMRINTRGTIGKDMQSVVSGTGPLNNEEFENVVTE